MRVPSTEVDEVLMEQLEELSSVNLKPQEPRSGIQTVLESQLSIGWLRFMDLSEASNSTFLKLNLFSFSTIN